MPEFDTPEPISAAIELALGDVRIIASDRATTVVEVRPTDSSASLDVTTAEQVRVTCSRGNLRIKGPKGWAPFNKVGSVDVVVELPAGSQVRAESAAVGFRSEGDLGECRFKTATGDLQLDRTDALSLSTAAGDVVVEHVAGRAEINTHSGSVRLTEVGGSASIKNSNGATWVGRIAGDLRVVAANGHVSVDAAEASLEVKNANGNIRVGEVVRGTASLVTAMGDVEVGVREGTSAWLDARSSFGRLDNSLTAADGPAAPDEKVELRVRTSFGDIAVRRSGAA
ncbi:DUF4097 family beta strand repeat-containing protein [Saccharopolyspora oryzae]|uniref:DUF4097 family beta strand repeat-containing protein n=1 Tax=Saccharopolyspora oryzae TaxID=2997343 RepID=A0ABT4UWA3_9PSEU|nr:DUF4097 family beta strand repeat-containing protein [Saccharopolyspora oryzae]MDA3625352.1 DUF4097 family beta strand repeat-containing protein [Saccharopolyspora oryzae]